MHPSHIARTIGITLLLAPIHGFAASFDCKKAATPVEEAICANPTLGALDQHIADAYGALLARVDDPLKPRVREAQRLWLKGRRNPRGLDKVLRARVEELHHAVFTQDGLQWLRLKGDERPLFILSKLPGTNAYNKWAEGIWNAAADDPDEESVAGALKECGKRDDCEVEVSMNRHYEISFASPDLVSVNESTSLAAYHAAHPSNDDSHFNFWLARPGEIQPADIFRDKAYEKVIRRHVRQFLKENFDRDDDDAKTALEPRNWAITAQALHITGQGYDYSIGRGFVEFDVAWEDFKNTANPDFVALLKK